MEQSFLFYPGLVSKEVRLKGGAASKNNISPPSFIPFHYNSFADTIVEEDTEVPHVYLLPFFTPFASLYCGTDNTSAKLDFVDNSYKFN